MTSSTPWWSLCASSVLPRNAKTSSCGSNTQIEVAKHMRNAISAKIERRGGELVTQLLD